MAIGQTSKATGLNSSRRWHSTYTAAGADSTAVNLCSPVVSTADLNGTGCGIRATTLRWIAPTILLERAERAIIFIKYPLGADPRAKGLSGNLDTERVHHAYDCCRCLL